MACLLSFLVQICNMSEISNYIAISEMVLLLLIVLILLVKLVTFYRVERQWNSITFFYFNQIQLKLTTSRELRKWRKSQNKLTYAILVFLIILFGIILFHQLILK